LIYSHEDPITARADRISKTLKNKANSSILSEEKNTYIPTDSIIQPFHSPIVKINEKRSPKQEIGIRIFLFFTNKSIISTKIAVKDTTISGDIARKS
jgi:hypothetical protein